jgi:hypothetical protein
MSPSNVVQLSCDLPGRRIASSERTGGGKKAGGQIVDVPFTPSADAPDNASLAHDQFFAEQDEWRRKLYTNELFREAQAAEGVIAKRG